MVNSRVLGYRVSTFAKGFPCGTFRFIYCFLIFLEMSAVLFPRLIGFGSPCFHELASHVLTGVQHTLGQPWRFFGGATHMCNGAAFVICGSDGRQQFIGFLSRLLLSVISFWAISLITAFASKRLRNSSQFVLTGLRLAGLVGVG